MKMTGRPVNADGACPVSLGTDGAVHELLVEARSTGQGMLANGGELPCTALGTCFCNDLYPEACP